MKKETCGKPWFIPRRFIEELGANAAYVLAKLCWLQKGATLEREGKRWFVCPIQRSGRKNAVHYRPLSDYFPWIKKSALFDIIKRLEDGKYIVINREFSKEMWKANKTLWYHVPDAIVRQYTYKKDEIFFYQSDAVELQNLNCAIVLNLIYREFRLELKREGDTHIRISRRKISQESGIKPSTVNDCFMTLQGKDKSGKEVPALLDNKCIASYDGGETFELLVTNPCNMRARGMGRHKLATYAGGTSSVNSNPHTTVITPSTAPGRHLINMAEDVWLVTIEKERIKQEARNKKKKRVSKRRKGRKLTENQWINRENKRMGLSDENEKKPVSRSVLERRLAKSGGHDSTA